LPLCLPPGAVWFSDPPEDPCSRLFLSTKPTAVPIKRIRIKMKSKIRKRIKRKSKIRIKIVGRRI
jgi:hypothetical protein